MKVHFGILRQNPIVTSLRTASDAWHKFWFEPADPLMLGIMRLLTGWMLFYNLLIWSLDLEAFFGDHGLQPLAAIRRIHESRLIFSFWLWIGDAYLWPIHFACLGITGMFCLGIATRVTSVLSFLITISYSQRVPIANFGFDQILGMLCLYLSLGPSGAAVSVDAWLRRWWLRRRGIEAVPQKFASARMSMRLIQLHLCAIYFWAGFAKLKGPSWWTGEAMWRVLANQEYQTMDLTWMAWVPWLPYLIAHITIVWEVFFIVLIWNPRFRPFMLLMGLGMHAGIGAFLGMWTFGLIMAFAYLAFSDPDIWRRRIAFIKNWLSRTSSMQLATPTESVPAMSLQRTMADTSEGPAAKLDANPSDVFGTRALNVPEQDMSFDREASPPHASSDSDSADARESSAASSLICIVATSSADRSSLRRYFREHNIACRAVGDLNSGLDAISRFRFTEVLVNGTRIPAGELIDFVADVADLTALPILVMLTHQQTATIVELKKIAQCQWMELPASLKSIRLQLASLKHNSSSTSDNASDRHPNAGPDPTDETRS